MRPLPNLRSKIQAVAAVAVACALGGGCAGLPRIDPTGQRCLIWPAKDQVVAPVGTVGPAVAPPFVGNPVAPPVGTDPFFPQVPAPQIAAPAAAAPATTVVAPASVSYPQVPQDRLTITPGRVLAPVGSEVVLKASICTTEGYTLANQQVEWMLGRNGVGQFVELGGKGILHPPLVPWNRGRKVDNYLAQGYTADGPLCIDRGTPDPTDDVNINRGDAWISVTSPNEGTSHVTAYTPAVESWDLRKAASTIYWVDVQWTFPPPAITSGGRETLTTVVTRQTDGTPIEGWIVRYEVADGGAVGGAGRVSEVRTGPDGRASVQVTPTGGSPSSVINTQLVRPANFGGSDAPQLVISSGVTNITWGGSQPYMPPVTSQPAPSTPPLQTSPAPPIQGAPITPQPTLPTTGSGRPRLELKLSGTQQVTVGGQAPLKMSVRNVGDAPATGVKLNDTFQAGLLFPNDPATLEINTKAPISIPPGETYEQELIFDVTKPGRLCHTVTVTFAEGSPISQTHCVEGAAAPQQREARLQVEISGPPEAVQGQNATFTINVKNVGQTSLVNVTLEEVYPTAFFEPQPAQNAQVISGRIARQVGTLEVGQSRQFQTTCRCLQATRATAEVHARAETNPPSHTIPMSDEHTVDIRAAGASAPPVQPPPQANAAGPLSVVVSHVNPTVLVGSRVMTTVTVTNKSNVPDKNVALRIYFPPNVTPDPLGVQGPPGLPVPTIQGEALVFAPLPTLNPTETARYVIPISPTQLGIVAVVAQAISANSPPPDGAKHSVNLEILSNLNNRR